jgi:hypothetical protein
MSEILLAIAAQVISAALIALITAAIRRAFGASPA